MLLLLLEQLEFKFGIFGLAVFQINQHLECFLLLFEADDVSLDIGVLLTEDADVSGDLLDVKFEVGGESWNVALPVPHLVLSGVQVILLLKHG
jgi:hypothetical protein